MQMSENSARRDKFERGERNAENLKPGAKIKDEKHGQRTVNMKANREVDHWSMIKRMLLPG